MRAGVDIGGTKTQAVIIDAAGRLVEQVRIRPGFGPEAVLASAVEALTGVAAVAGTTVQRLGSIGVGIPGTVDVASGRVTHAVNLGIADLALGGELAGRLGALVRVENDVNAAAFGAFHRLAGGSTSMAYLNLGTGLAAGFVLNGELWRGSRGGAGEIGHIPIDPAGPVCSCGQRGCLETVASGSAIARAWPTEDGRSVQHLFAAAAWGDPRAIEVKRQLVGGVASAVRVLVLTVDVDMVVIGGGLSSLGEPLLRQVRGVLEARAAQSAFVASMQLPDRVRVTPPGFPAAAVGAALVGAVMSEAA